MPMMRDKVLPAATDPAKRVIARRAALELRSVAVLNFGVDGSAMVAPIVRNVRTYLTGVVS